MTVSNSKISWHAPLPELGILAVGGKDAAKLLQGQTTCDILGLPPGRTTLGALCTPKGRAVAVFRVLRTEDRILLLLPAEMLETVRMRLSMYVLRSDVSIEDISDQWRIFGLFGEKSAVALQAMGLPPLAHDNEAEGQKGVYAGFYAIRIPGVDAARFLVLVDAAKAGGFGRFLEGHGLRPALAMRWLLEDIRAGIPVVTAATAEEFVPQMLNLDLLGGISFNKGCYTGQEIIARTHYLGSLKRRMARLFGEGEPLPRAGETLRTYGGEVLNAGMVVCAAPTPEDGFELLAVMNSQLAEEPGAAFATADGLGLVLAGLPYSLPPASRGEQAEG